MTKVIGREIPASKATTKKNIAVRWYKRHAWCSCTYDIESRAEAQRRRFFLSSRPSAPRASKEACQKQIFGE